MPRPFNWNPIRIQIERLDKDDPCVDDTFRVPVETKKRPQLLEYQAQINFRKKEQDAKERAPTGDRASTRGWLVMRTADLAPNTSLPKPQKGDRIVKLYVGTDQEQDVQYPIVEVRHESPLRGRALLLYSEFERDRERNLL